MSGVIHFGREEQTMKYLFATTKQMVIVGHVCYWVCNWKYWSCQWLYLFWDFFLFRIALNGNESRNSVEGLTYRITGLEGDIPPHGSATGKEAAWKYETNKTSTPTYRKRNFKCICLRLIEWSNLVQEVQCLLDVLMLCSHGPIFQCKQPWDPNRIYLCISQGHLRLNTCNNFTGFCTEPTFYVLHALEKYMNAYVIDIWSGSL